MNTGDNSHRGNTAKQFRKIVLSNNQGKLVQVTGWGHNSKLLKDAFEVGKVKIFALFFKLILFINFYNCMLYSFQMVYIGPATACAVKSMYNLGNCGFELALKENTVVEVHGVYTNPALQLNLLSTDCTIEKAYQRVGKLVS